MKKVAIYGTGKAAQYFAEHHEFSGEELQYYVETEKKKESFRNHNIIGIREIDLSLDVVYVVNSCWSRAEIATHSRLEITNFSRSEIANAAADSFLLRL